MHKLVQAIVLAAAASGSGNVSAAVDIQFANGVRYPFGGDNAIVLIGGMNTGGMTGGGMTGGGMTGGGMTGGGMTGGGMTGGGMTGGGMTGGMGGGGIIGIPGGLPGYMDLPVYGGVSGDTGGGQSYGPNGPSPTGAQSRKIYHCLTPSGRCAVDSTFGTLRKGDSCGCLFGGPGKIQ